MRVAHTCGRCNRAIPDGGLFYRVTLSALSGYDGVIDPSADLSQSQILEEIAGKKPEDLEHDIHFEQEVILCYACRTAIIDLFRGEVGKRGGSDTTGNNLLH
jgi:hypothetical protein